VHPNLATTFLGIDTARLFEPAFPSAAEFDQVRTLFLLTGGFPELLVDAFSEEPEEGATPVAGAALRDALLRSQQVLRDDAVERAIYKDIPQVFGVDRPMLLERMLYVLADQVTKVLEPKTLCQTLDGLSQPTFDRYLSYLERSFLVFTLPNYSGSESAVQRRGRKLYFVDTAIRNAALQLGLAPLFNPGEMGVLLENMAASHLFALAQQTQTRLYHWREGNRWEVDLVYDHPDTPACFEIASSGGHGRAGLNVFLERFPRFRGRAFLVYPGAPIVLPEANASSGIGTLSLDAFLLGVGAQTAAALGQRLS
jgi:predicted AAA+ superfamily ATPase